jgi:hypothetical protein
LCCVVVWRGIRASSSCRLGLVYTYTCRLLLSIYISCALFASCTESRATLVQLGRNWTSRHFAEPELNSPTVIQTTRYPSPSNRTCIPVDSHVHELGIQSHAEQHIAMSRTISFLECALTFQSQVPSLPTHVGGVHDDTTKPTLTR